MTPTTGVTTESLRTNLARALVESMDDHELHRVRIGNRPEHDVLYFGQREGDAFVLLDGVEIEVAWQGDPADMEQRFRDEVEDSARSYADHVDTLEIKYDPGSAFTITFDLPNNVDMR